MRLLRADKGKAFVDLLNEKANDSGENEMGYVERTLGFSTRHLDDRDIRLVKFIYLTCSNVCSVYEFQLFRGTYTMLGYCWEVGI